MLTLSLDRLCDKKYLSFNSSASHLFTGCILFCLLVRGCRILEPETIETAWSTNIGKWSEGGGGSFQDYSWIQDFEDDFPQKVILKILN